jgi:hypothetical protein
VVGQAGRGSDGAHRMVCRQGAKRFLAYIMLEASEGSLCECATVGPLQEQEWGRIAPRNSST